ncbi:MAG TPA: hypothetical protein VFZ14_16640 [Burkholderiales bacterium]|nr:hypothetical protein [Burkholderiales bacterium]
MPVGEYCYRWESIVPPGTPAAETMGGFGLRRTVRCPFWTQTRRGTVRCALTGEEEWDIGDRYNRAVKLLGAERANGMYPPASDLQDEIKTCGVNTKWQVYEDDPDSMEAASAVEDYFDREATQPPGVVLSDVSIGQFVWHRESGFGVVTDRFADYHGLGCVALVLFRWDYGEEAVLLSDGSLHDDPLPAGAAPPDPRADPLDAAFASIPSRLAAIRASE